jgi:hypothetical protein
MDIFIAHQSLFGLQLYAPRLRASVAGDSCELDSLDPSLENAIFLLACSLGGSEMGPYEEIFLRRARTSSAEALAHVRRLDEYVLGSLIQTIYLVRVGRMREAYEMSSSAYFSIPLPHWKRLNL